MAEHRCPFVQAVGGGDLDEARRLSVLDGEECEPAVFDKLVEWARNAASRVDPKVAIILAVVHGKVVTPAPDALCSHEPCAGCGWCAACRRVVGTPHMPVCVCPPETLHSLCPACHAKFVAWALTRGEHDERKWWEL